MQLWVCAVLSEEAMMCRVVVSCEFEVLGWSVKKMYGQPVS